MKTTNRRSPRRESSVSDLIKLRRQLDGWRKSQPGRARLPSEVWDQAASPLPVPPAPSGFIELPPLASPGSDEGGCVVELCDGGQARMTVRLSGESSALLGLAEAFWRRGR